MRLRTARELGVLIRDVRRQAGLTQAQVADRMRATQKWVSAIENGKDTAEIGQVLRLLALLRIEITILPANDRTPASFREEQTMFGQDSRKPRQARATRRAGGTKLSPPPAPVPQLAEAGLDLDLMLDDMKGDKPR